MTRAGTPDSALQRFDNCGALARVFKNERTGDYKVRASYCHSRWCLPCGRAKGLLVADNLVAKLGTSRGLHIILTRAHSTRDLCDQVRDLKKAFAKLRLTSLWKNAIPGGAWFVQAHPSTNDGLWHVHAHVFAEGRFIDVHKLSDAWKKVTGDSDNVRAYPVNGAGRLAREVARYVGRPFKASLASHPDLLAELMIALRGTRLCQTFGSWGGWKLTTPHLSDEPDEWTLVGSLTSITAQAKAGDVESLIILRKLLTKSHPAIGPPALLAIDPT